VHDFVTPEVIDERVARLHGMHQAVRRWRFEKRAQFHEVMAGAARVEAVERNEVLFAALERMTVVQRHRCNSVIHTLAFQFRCEAEQIPPFVTGIDFFHHSFDFIGCELRRHDVVLVRNHIPNVVYRFRAGEEVCLFVEHAVHRHQRRRFDPATLP